MALPAVVWGGIWAVGAIGARIAARQIVRQVVRAAAQRAVSQAARAAYSAAVAQGTLAPQDWTGLDQSYANADDRANALARSMAAACAADPAKCRACASTAGAPGAPAARNLSPRAAAYQQFITGFPRGVEYSFQGVWFDGFWMPICTLVEAKDKYDQFLVVEIDEAWLWGGDSISSVRFKDWFSGKAELVSEGRRHENAIRPHREVKLQWHCSQIAFNIALTSLFSAEGIGIVSQYTPHPTATDPHGRYIN